MSDIERQKEYEEFMAEPKQRISMHIYLLPNLMTTGNLFFGFYAIILSLKQNYEYAAYAIVAAAIFDLLDGRLARLTRSTSKFGAEYDSLCDLISFGMAPALVMYLWALQPLGRIGWIACFLFLTCGALRLARFNVQASVIEKAYFQGLPIPMAAGIVASSILAFNALGWESQGSKLLLFMTILLAAVMISNFRYRSFKDLDLKQRLPFHYLVIGVLIIAAVAYRPEVHLFVLFISYAILGALFGVMGWGRQKFRRNVYMPKLAHHESDLIVESNPNEED
jgi:CDP-diacylglycerol--serine O-phosphatidyltransferase